jgi:sigma-B regulation protein RsbU (phosphoserine phosphatase)
MRETTGNSYRIFSPSQVLKNLNSGIAEQRLSGCQFATCSYFLLNTQNLKLTFARAGHPYPILLRKGKKPIQLESRGSLLGIFPETQFLQKTIQLQQGDKLFLYSDGAEELVGRVDDAGRYNFNKEFEHMKDRPLQQMMDKFEKLVTGHLPQLAGSDDVTAIGLEIL